MNDLKGPASELLPPVRVEKPLFDTLYTQAKAEGRTISDVIRCAIRDGIKAQAQQGKP